MKASDLARAFQELMPKGRDEVGREVPFPIKVVELFESPSRRGYGPQGRAFTPYWTLVSAAMKQLYRDDVLGEQVRWLGGSRPACVGLDPEIPTRFMVDHVTIGGHDVGPCREWMSRVVGLAYDAGCPSLDAMLGQFKAVTGGMRPGRFMAARLRDDPPPGPKRPIGTRDRPVMGLLARRAYWAGGVAALRACIAKAQSAHGIEPIVVHRDPLTSDRRGWPGLALEMEGEIREWEQRREPDPLDITHPAWEEWQRSAHRRTGRDRVRVEDSVRLAAPHLGQSYGKAARDIDKTLRANLPVGLIHGRYRAMPRVWRERPLVEALPARHWQV